LSPKKAVELAVNDLISHDDGRSGPWYFTKEINGQQLAVQAARDDQGRKPSRTKEEVLQLGEKLRFAINQIPIDQIQTENPNGTSVIAGADLILSPEQKRKFIKDAIRSQSTWVTSSNGQGAQIYLRGRDFGFFPLRDKSGKIWEVDYDEVAKAPLDPFTETGVKGLVIQYGEKGQDNAYVQTRAAYPVMENIVSSATSPMKLSDGVSTEFTLNIMSQYWKNLKGFNKPKSK
jgi:hypothetical protein